MNYRITEAIAGLRDGRIVKLSPGDYRVVGRTTVRGRPARRVENTNGATYLMLASHWAILRDLGIVVPGGRR